jgi:ParB-like chromosome segregation protein Spo0J
VSDNGNEKLVQNLDIPIVKLVPRNVRRLGQKHRRRLEASLRAVGLLERLIVYPQGDHYAIVDGCLRYRILLEMGVETVPCLVWNRQADFHLGATLREDKHEC